MAIKGGPRIPKDGLVLSLDAANSKSFRGEPTTNLLSQPLTFETGYTYESWTTGEIEDNAIIAPDGTKTATRVKRVSGYFYKTNTASPTFTISAGDTITFSCWVKKLDSSLTGGIIIWCYNNTNGPRAWSTEQIYNDRWVRQSVTYTAQTGETSFAFNFSGQYGIMLQGELAIWHPQIELKPYATPFVNGTRGTTVATGGGWADITNNSNHGELLNGTAYDSGSFGSLSFDGVDDEVSIPYNSASMDFSLAQTICMWLKPAAGSNTARRNPYNQAYGGSGTLTYETNGAINYYFGTNGGNGWPYVGKTSGFTIAQNELAFISVTRDQNNNVVNWYKNGNFWNTHDAGGYSTVTNSTYPIRIGKGYVSGFLGDIYITLVYNRALTAEEIKNIYAATRGRFGL